MKVPKGSYKRLLLMTKQDWKYGVLAMIGSIGGGFIGPVCASLLGDVVAFYYDPDKAEMKRNLSKFSVYFVILGASSLLVTFLQHYSLGVLGEKLVNLLREKLFASKQEPDMFS
jgi:ABC-type multidrug transport system fused ATPase/permease subunit